ncbi:MAG: DUF1003 domain-containing protein [Saccharofermentanales bacterium]
MNSKKHFDYTNIIELASEKRSKNINEVHEESLTRGEKIADKMADFAGSWKFIIIFISILLFWILVNSLQLLYSPFDPFPFILLNLILSCIAALQAPVIMMSQNRQEKKDRIKAEHDYEINMKAEILIEELLNRLISLEQKQDEIIINFNKIDFKYVGEAKDAKTDAE